MKNAIDGADNEVGKDKNKMKWREEDGRGKVEERKKKGKSIEKKGWGWRGLPIGKKDRG